jgi:HEAT repeat protein
MVKVERSDAAGFLVLGDLLGKRAPALRAERRRMAIGTLPGFAAQPDPDEPVATAAPGRPLRVQMVELLADDRDPAVRAAIARQIATLGSPLPAGVLRALAVLSSDADVRVRRQAATSLVHLFEVLTPIARSELIGRLATSSRRELRLLVVLALRHGAVTVGTVSALEYLVDDDDLEVRAVALISARLRLADAPVRLTATIRRRLAR